MTPGLRGPSRTELEPLKLGDELNSRCIKSIGSDCIPQLLGEVGLVGAECGVAEFVRGALEKGERATGSLSAGGLSTSIKV